MSVAAVCPECQARIELPSEVADLPIRCLRCQQPFERDLSAGIQTKATPIAAATRKKDAAEEPPLSPRRPTARSPFPMTSVLVVVLGLMFFLFVFSVGFNVWFLLTPENRFRRAEEAMRAEQAAQIARQQAEQAAENARALQLEQARQHEIAQQRLIELQDELKMAKDQLEEANRKLEKQAK